MKTLTLILTVCLLFLCSSSFAQVKTNHIDAHQHSGVPEKTKGYYSIGNNAKKLSDPSSWGISFGESYPNVQKGYYSIGNNNKKLGKQLVIKGNRKSTTPVVTKGYFSIGQNGEKLKQ